MSPRTFAAIDIDGFPFSDIESVENSCIGPGRPSDCCLGFSCRLENWSAPDNNATTSIGLGNNVWEAFLALTLWEIPDLNEGGWRDGFLNDPCEPIWSGKIAEFVIEVLNGAGNVNRVDLLWSEGLNVDGGTYDRSIFDGCGWDISSFDPTVILKK